jgi:uncharacterized membrane protein
MTSDPQPVTNKSPSKAAGVAGGVIVWFATHWLAIFNTAWALYTFIPFLAPLFMRLGWTVPAQGIYTVYSFLCHQLPTHSYFLFGSDFAPPAQTLIANGMSESTNLFRQRVFLGNETIGWKVALCERDVAIYATVFFTGILYAFVRDRLRPLPFKIYLLFVIPIAVDGFTQLFGWRESNWWLRTLTGVLFGFGSVWLAYPYVEEAMQEVIEEEYARTKLKAEGSNPPTT